MIHLSCYQAVCAFLITSNRVHLYFSPRVRRQLSGTFQLYNNQSGLELRQPQVQPHKGYNGGIKQGIVDLVIIFQLQESSNHGRIQVG